MQKALRAVLISKHLDNTSIIKRYKSNAKSIVYYMYILAVVIKAVQYLIMR